MNPYIPNPPPGYRWKLAIDPHYGNGLRGYWLELRKNLPLFFSRRVDQQLLGADPYDVHRDTVRDAALTLLERIDERAERRRFNETIRAFNDDQGRDQ